MWTFQPSFDIVIQWKRGQVPIVRSTLRAVGGYWYLTPFRMYDYVERSLECPHNLAFWDDESEKIAVFVGRFGVCWCCDGARGILANPTT